MGNCNGHLELEDLVVLSCLVGFSETGNHVVDDMAVEVERTGGFWLPFSQVVSPMRIFDSDGFALSLDDAEVDERKVYSHLP